MESNVSIELLSQSRIPDIAPGLLVNSQQFVAEGVKDWWDAPRPDSCIHQLFERQVERTPAATAVVFGEEARFVDEQESGPFKSWRHEHDFERIDEKNTRMLDRVTYRVPFGPIGAIVDWIYLRRKIKRSQHGKSWPDSQSTCGSRTS